MSSVRRRREASFPGAAWERTARAAPPRLLAHTRARSECRHAPGRAWLTWHSQAKPGNEETWCEPADKRGHQRIAPRANVARAAPSDQRERDIEKTLGAAPSRKRESAAQEARMIVLDEHISRRRLLPSGAACTLLPVSGGIYLWNDQPSDRNPCSVPSSWCSLSRPPPLPRATARRNCGCRRT